MRKNYNFALNTLILRFLLHVIEVILWKLCVTFSQSQQIPYLLEAEILCKTSFKLTLSHADIWMNIYLYQEIFFVITGELYASHFCTYNVTWFHSFSVYTIIYKISLNNFQNMIQWKATITFLNYHHYFSATRKKS